MRTVRVRHACGHVAVHQFGHEPRKSTLAAYEIQPCDRCVTRQLRGLVSEPARTHRDA
jgi:hypothetical protein